MGKEEDSKRRAQARDSKRRAQAREARSKVPQCEDTTCGKCSTCFTNRNRQRNLIGTFKKMCEGHGQQGDGFRYQEALSQKGVSERELRFPPTAQTPIKSDPEGRNAAHAESQRRYYRKVMQTEPCSEGTCNRCKKCHQAAANTRRNHYLQKRARAAVVNGGVNGKGQVRFSATVQGQVMQRDRDAVMPGRAELAQKVHNTRGNMRREQEEGYGTRLLSGMDRKGKKRKKQLPVNNQKRKKKKKQ